jgi:hypothetical protein
VFLSPAWCLASANCRRVLHFGLIVQNPFPDGTSGNIDEVLSLGFNPVKTLYHVLAGAIGHPGLGESGICNG